MALVATTTTTTTHEHEPKHERKLERHELTHAGGARAKKKEKGGQEGGMGCLGYMVEGLGGA